VLERRDALLDARGREAEPDGEREDDARVPEREEEADAERLVLVVLGEELARRVVDRRDVVASNACRSPNVYASTPSPTSSGLDPA
jgi:hypothetical protein